MRAILSLTAAAVAASVFVGLIQPGTDSYTHTIASVTEKGTIAKRLIEYQIPGDVVTLGSFRCSPNQIFCMYTTLSDSTVQGSLYNISFATGQVSRVFSLPGSELPAFEWDDESGCAYVVASNQQEKTLFSICNSGTNATKVASFGALTGSVIAGSSAICTQTNATSDERVMYVLFSAVSSSPQILSVAVPSATVRTAIPIASQPVVTSLQCDPNAGLVAISIPEILSVGSNGRFTSIFKGPNPPAGLAPQSPAAWDPSTLTMLATGFAGGSENSTVWASNLQTKVSQYTALKTTIVGLSGPQ